MAKGVNADLPLRRFRVTASHRSMSFEVMVRTIPGTISPSRGIIA
jgi:hypothetical protein